MMTPPDRFGSVPLTIMYRRGETQTDWQPDPKIREFHFPGGTNVEVQGLGFGLLAVSYRVRFQNEHDFAAFLALIGTEQTLRVPFTSTAYPGDRDGQLLNDLYKEFDHVLLSPPVTNIRRYREGVIDVEATFKRRMP